MGRARQNDTRTTNPEPVEEFDDNSTGPTADGPVEESVSEMPGSRPLGDLFQQGPKKLRDPRTVGNEVKADATAKNRRDTEHTIMSARTLGGDSFRRLEQKVVAAKNALLDAAPGADLAALQTAYRLAKEEHDAAADRYAEEARKKAEVKRYEVQDNNGGKGRLAATDGSVGRAKLHPGKVIDSLNYDIPALLRQGIRLKELSEGDESAVA